MAIKVSETTMYNYEEDDKVIFMGLAHSLDILAGKFFHEKEFVKNVAIIGGGTIGLKLAKSLEDLKINTKIIERDEERCEILAEQIIYRINNPDTQIYCIIKQPYKPAFFKS